MRNYRVISSKPRLPWTSTDHLATLARRLFFIGALAASAVLSNQAAFAQSVGSYQQTNIISDGSVQALQTDPTLINPWGVSLGAKFWIDSAGTGFSQVDDANGNKAFSVSIPGAKTTEAHGNPAGTVANNDASAFIIPGSSSALFLFGDLDGSIAAWNASTPQAVIVVNNSAAHAVYTDIALDKNSTGTFLLAANFAGGTVDVFDSSFAPAHLAGSFTDPALPQGYSPYGIHSIGANIYVTYSERDSSGHQVLGAGLGLVDVFDNNGNFVKEAIMGGNLNAPWGMAVAPSGFGSFGSKLLVANFGDGTISAYDPASFSLLGQIKNSTGTTIVNTGLWEIVFGSNGLGDPNTLYFAAGINSEKGGLFGAIAPMAPAANADFSIQASATSLAVTNGQSGSVTLNLAGSNGFNGAVSFSCSGLPAGATCTFTPPTATVPVMSSVSVVASINTVATPAPVPSPYIAARHPLQSLSGHTGTMLAFAFPFGLFGVLRLRKRRSLLGGSLLAAVLMLGVLTTMGMTGCSGASMTTHSQTQPTPAMSQVSINATSGAITHTVTVALTVN